MGSFQKKSQIYTRPTGRRARPIWQVFWAFLRHDVITSLGVMVVIYLAIFCVGFTVIAKTFFESLSEYGFTLAEAFQKMFTENEAKWFAPFSLLPIVFAFFVAMALFEQLIHAKQFSVPRGISAVLRFGMVICLVVALASCLILLKLTWIGSLWSFATFLLSTGIVTLCFVRGRNLLAILAAIVAALAMAFAMQLFPDHGFDTERFEWTVVSLSVFLAGIGTWWASWRQFHRGWVLTGENIAIIMRARRNRFQTRLQLLAPGTKEFWLSAWFERERERRAELVHGVKPQTLRDRFRFFQTIHRPTRMRFSMTLIAVVISPLVVTLYDKPQLLLILGGGTVLVALIPVVFEVAFQWRQFFSTETLFPMSRKQYLLVAGLSRIGNLVRAMLPLLIFFSILFAICDPHFITFTNVAILILVCVSFVLCVIGCFLIAIVLPLVVLGWMVAGVFIWTAFRIALHESTCTIDIIMFFLLSIALIPFSLWRLYHIEPDRVGRS